MNAFLEESFLSISDSTAKAQKNNVVRDSILRKMLMNRNKLRILISPNFFGKTSVCRQYASVVYNNKNVIWLDASSIEFMRDLDNGLVAKFILQKKPNLVVFDNLFVADIRRANLIKELIEKILNETEVVINLHIENTPLVHKFKNAEVIETKDFILDDKELNANEFINPDDKYAIFKNTISRIPGVYFNKNQKIKVLNNNAKEIFKKMDKDTISLIFLMTLIKNGNLNDISQLFSIKDKNQVSAKLNSYLIFSINESHNKFFTADFTIKDLVGLFNSYINVSGVLTNKRLLDKIIEQMVRNSDYARIYEICSFIKDVKLLRVIVNKYLFNCINYLNYKYFIELLDLSEMKIFNNNRSLLIKKLLNSYINIILENEEESLETAYNIIKSSGNLSLQVFASTIFILSGSTTDKQKAKRILECLYKKSVDNYNKEKTMLAFTCMFICKSAKNDFDINISKKELTSFNLTEIKLLLICIKLSYFNEQSIIKNRNSIVEELSVIFEDLQENNIYKTTFIRTLFYKQIINKLSVLKELNIINLPNDEFMFSLFNAGSNKIEEESTSCRTINLSKFHEHTHKIINFNRNLSDNKLNNSALNYQKLDGSNIEPLYVNLFDCFNVKVGDKDITYTSFKRKKLKVLLAYLVINSGREVNANRLTSSLWPLSSSDVALKNLNSLWSMLRSELEDSSGDCPYLNRNYHSFSINSNLIVTDIQKYKSIKNEFNVGLVNANSWIALAKNNLHILQGELMPCEIKNEYILKKREWYKNSTAEFLTNAAHRLYDVKELEACVWFANLACELDSTREDSFYILMKAQYALGLRSSAIKTYLSSIESISNSNKIPISSKFKRLYEAVINETPINKMMKSIS